MNSRTLTRQPRPARPRAASLRGLRSASPLIVRWLLAGGALVSGLTAHGVAYASEDAAVHKAVQDTMTEDYPGSLGPAKSKLSDALGLCLRKGCTGKVKAEVHVALGMVASQLGQVDEAKEQFASALRADAAAKLPATGVTPNIRAQWALAAKSAAPPAAPATEAPPPAEEAAIPEGWKSAEAFKLAKQGLDADQAGKLDECIAKDQASLELDEQPRTRLHLASCESRAGKLVEATKDAQKALEMGLQKRDAGVMKVARQRVKDLLDRIPHVTFAPPAGVTDLVVKFDDRPVPTNALTKKFSVNPGKHQVVAEGLVNGLPATFEQQVDIKERELVTVTITLKPQGGAVTPAQIKCMLQAKSQEEVQKCLPQNTKNLVIRVGADFSGYADTNSVYVVSPGFNASVTSPTSGWNVGGNFLVDAVSAASPDIVSTASPPFRERRYAGGLSGGYKPGTYGVQALMNVSSEPDYLSVTGGAAITADLNDKLITPRLGYSYTHDNIYRGPDNPTNNLFQVHEFELGVTFVLSPTMVVLVGATAQFERGDQSKPYRYVPTFDPVTVAPFVPNGATIDLVNKYRQPIRPLEQLPTERDRYAFGARLNKRIGNATLRLEQRFYFDTWLTKASTTDMRYMVDLTRRLRLWPHLRFHAQTAANFYQLAYPALADPGGITPTTLFTYRSNDRELSPMVSATVGGGLRVALGSLEGDVRYGISFVGDLLYSRYFKALFLTARTGVYGTVAFDAEF
ncbi:MAG: DUF3570 domain-containing protein [Myxococcales bacterium]|nr:DUF3570 domain-containing protein [Myxococcales bacterium]MBL0194996.1 DUF3570 domain-containing protein [Myxococcales bacterium]HQY60388.1 DUF3570 domain-containing protein [Polyangiaceae bacterium]